RWYRRSPILHPSLFPRVLRLFCCLARHGYLPSFPTRRSSDLELLREQVVEELLGVLPSHLHDAAVRAVDDHHTGVCAPLFPQRIDRKSTRLNSSHVSISYAVFCL